MSNEKFSELIFKVFNTRDYKISKYDKGLSNQNYLLVIKNQKYILRQPLDESKHLFNRKHEEIVMTKCQDLDLEVIYFDVFSGIKITKFNNQVVDYDECNDEDKIIRVAQMIKTLHHKTPVDFSFKPIEVLDSYRHQISKPLYNLDKYHNVIDSIKHLNNKQVLCHNDLVSGNLLFSNERDYLIDYEYAANNDPLFDVMSFISENNLNEKDRNIFYQAYFDKINDKLLNELALWEAFHDLLWCYWAMMMYEKLNQDVYKRIANDKYQALKKVSN